MPPRQPSATDLRFVEAYTIPQAAQYVGAPLATLRSWVLGRGPVISPIKRGGQRYLSFVGLIEAYVLNCLRREYRIRLNKIRHAVQYLRKRMGTRQPLAEARFLTDGGDLFVHEAVGATEHLIIASEGGQLAIRDALEPYLRRVEYEDDGLPCRFYPLVGSGRAGGPRIILIDPRISFGRPVLAGTGIPTEVLAERFAAGESIESIATDYDRNAEEVEEAIRCELNLAA